MRLLPSSSMDSIRSGEATPPCPMPPQTAQYRGMGMTLVGWCAAELQAPHFAQRQRLQFAQECAALERGRQPLSEQDTRLAAYLALRSLKAQAIDSNRLRALREANDSVEQTRRQLSYGRGNVSNDLQRSLEPGWRVRFMHQQPGNGWAYRTALAMKMAAGNCDEHADVAMAVHAGKLAPGESVQGLGGKHVKHAWAETRLADGERIVMDAWAEGPAILAEDSGFSRQCDDRTEHLSLNHAEGRRFARQTQRELSRLQDHPALDEQWRAAKQEAQRENWRFSKIWAPTPVLHADFWFEALPFHQSDQVEKQLRQNHIAVDDALDRLVQNDAIRTVGAARALGASLRQALAQMEAIDDEVERLWTFHADDPRTTEHGY